VCCRYHSCEDVPLLESIIATGKKLELSNHEAVRALSTQLDRAKRIIIVQQAIVSAVSRSNIIDLEASIATASQLVGDDRDFLIHAKKTRSLHASGYLIVEMSFFIRFAGSALTWRRAFVQLLTPGTSCNCGRRSFLLLPLKISARASSLTCRMYLCLLLLR
jgi:hypothetical protein